MPLCRQGIKDFFLIGPRLASSMEVSFVVFKSWWNHLFRWKQQQQQQQQMVWKTSDNLHKSFLIRLQPLPAFDGSLPRPLTTAFHGLHINYAFCCLIRDHLLCTTKVFQFCQKAQNMRWTVLSFAFYVPRYCLLTWSLPQVD